MIIAGASILVPIITVAVPGILGHLLALIVWVAAAWSCVRPARARTPSAARTWARIGVAAFACLAVYAGSLAIVRTSQNWYADGKAFAVRDNKLEAANLVGPPGIVQTWCTGVVDLGNAAEPTGPLPPSTDSSAVSQWVSGCMEGYAETHPNDPDGTAGTIWAPSPSAAAPAAASPSPSYSLSAAAPAAGSPSPSYTPLTLACRLQYWIPASAPFTYTYSASGWQPISGPQDDFGGDSPDQAPPGWPNAYALSGNLPAGWRQGAHVVISDSGTPPPQAQGEAKVTVAFQDPNAKTVYTTSVDVNLGSAQGDVSQFPIEFNVSAGLSATGANACTATAST